MLGPVGKIFYKLRSGLQRIHRDTNIRFGKPCIKGTRISVYDVLSWLAGMTSEEIVNDFPHLTKNQILACLAYSADKERKATVAL